MPPISIQVINKWNSFEGLGAGPSILSQTASLNKKGGLQFVLSHTWDRALWDMPSQLSHVTYVFQAE